MTLTTRRLLLLSVMLTIFARSSNAGQEAPRDPELVKILQRVDDLEVEVRSLKAQLRDAAGAKPTAPEAATNASTEPEQASTADQGSSHPMEQAMEQASEPRLRIRGYGDVGWRGDDLRGSTNSFALGQLNLFMTSHITDKVSFLAEAIIEADQSTNEFGIEPERLLLIYNAGDWLNLSFGRYHTGIGYYNTAYHHSALMQTTLGRPFLFAFEDAGGILPIHNVGISATGTLSSKYGLHYIAEIGNGRSLRRDGSPVQNVTDDNNGKAFNLALFVRPNRVRGTQFGFSEYHDHLSPPGGTKAREIILAAHAVYQNSRFEFLNEAVWMQHSPDRTNFTVNIPGFYSQVSRRWGSYRPYFRYEYLNVPSRDPFYSNVGLLHGPKIGLRYDLGEFSAIKVEYGRDMGRGQDAVNSLGTQLSFAF